GVEVVEALVEAAAIRLIESLKHLIQPKPFPERFSVSMPLWPIGASFQHRGRPANVERAHDVGPVFPPSPTAKAHHCLLAPSDNLPFRRLVRLQPWRDCRPVGDHETSGLEHRAGQISIGQLGICRGKRHVDPPWVRTWRSREALDQDQPLGSSASLPSSVGQRLAELVVERPRRNPQQPANFDTGNFAASNQVIGSVAANPQHLCDFIDGVADGAATAPQTAFDCAIAGGGDRHLRPLRLCGGVPNPSLYTRSAKSDVIPYHPVWSRLFTGISRWIPILSSPASARGDRILSACVNAS